MPLRLRSSGASPNPTRSGQASTFLRVRLLLPHRRLTRTPQNTRAPRRMAEGIAEKSDTTLSSELLLGRLSRRTPAIDFGHSRLTAKKTSSVIQRYTYIFTATNAPI